MPHRRRGRFKKGSLAAKLFMAKIRGKRKGARKARRKRIRHVVHRVRRRKTHRAHRLFHAIRRIRRRRVHRRVKRLNIVDFKLEHIAGAATGLILTGALAGAVLNGKSYAASSPSPSPTPPPTPQPTPMPSAHFTIRADTSLITSIQQSVNITGSSPYANTQLTIQQFGANSDTTGQGQLTALQVQTDQYGNFSATMQVAANINSTAAIQYVAGNYTNGATSNFITIPTTFLANTQLAPMNPTMPVSQQYGTMSAPWPYGSGFQGGGFYQTSQGSSYGVIHVPNNIVTWQALIAQGIPLR